MTGILPDGVNGAKVVRDAAKACLAPTGVSNAYCPPNTFNSTCEITGLPSDCTARITPAQINALVSEMLALAVAMDPTGTWNCAAVTNLAAAFANWKDGIGNADGTTIGGDGSTADPYTVIPAGLVAAICADLAAKTSLATCMISSDPGNGLLIGADGGIVGAGSATNSTIDGTGSPADPFGVNVVNLVTALCASNAAGDALASCLRSTNANNGLVLGTDGRLKAPKSDFYNAQTFGGSANAMTASAVPTLTSATLNEGSVLVGIQLATNTSSTVTMTVDGVLKSVKRADGTTNLAAGDLIAGHQIMYRYDAVNNVWAAVMDMTTGVNIPASAAATPLNDYINGNTTTGSGTAYVVTGSRPLQTAAPVDNSVMTVTFHTNNTSSAPTIKIDSLAAVTLKDATGAALSANDITAGHTYQLVYDSGSSTWRVARDLTDGSLPGISGPNVIYGQGAPAASVGRDGDYYFDIDSNQWYGQKASGTWGMNDRVGSDFYNLQTSTGTATAYNSPSPRPDMPNAGPRGGAIAVMTVNVTNTGTNPTLQCSGGSVWGLRRGDGSNIVAGDLVATHDVMMIYDAATARWRVVMDLTTGTPLGSGGSTNAFGGTLLASGTVNAAANVTIADIVGLAGWNRLLVFIKDDSGGPFASAGFRFSNDNGATFDTTGYTARTSAGAFVTNRITQFVWDTATFSVVGKFSEIELTGFNTGQGIAGRAMDIFLGSNNNSVGNSSDAVVRNAMRIYNDGAAAANFTYRVYGILRDF